VILDRNYYTMTGMQEEKISQQAAYLEMGKVLRPLIYMADSRGVKIEAESPYKQSRLNQDTGECDLWNDPLVDWFNNYAVLPELKANIETAYDCETSEQWRRAINKCQTPKLAYAIVPGCRQCLKVFADDEKLKGHLQKTPSHVIVFRKKAWNVLHRRAAFGGGEQICPTCAKPFTLMYSLYDHMREAGHHRRSLIP
jgi:hypothetical protein